ERFMVPCPREPTIAVLQDVIVEAGIAQVHLDPLEPGEDHRVVHLDDSDQADKRGQQACAPSTRGERAHVRPIVDARRYSPHLSTAPVAALVAMLAYFAR